MMVLAVYLWRHADEQADDEAQLFGVGPRMTHLRALSPKAVPSSSLWWPWGWVQSDSGDAKVPIPVGFDQRTRCRARH
jgi:hypothetical protein